MLLRSEAQARSLCFSCSCLASNLFRHSLCLHTPPEQRGRSLAGKHGSCLVAFSLAQRSRKKHLLHFDLLHQSSISSPTLAIAPSGIGSSSGSIFSSSRASPFHPPVVARLLVIEGFLIDVVATSAASSLALFRNCPSYQ